MTGPQVTRETLVTDLRALGVPAGGALLVHCSFRRVGLVEGGPPTLLAALRETLGPAGTIVVPAQTANNSLTSPVYRAATAGMSEAERARFQDTMPGFDPGTTPSYGVGVLAEQVRSQPEALRSGHPQTSFAALGPAAADNGASILLLGVGLDKCTAVHLAEYRLVPANPIMRYSCFVIDKGRRKKLQFEAPALDDSDFAGVGADLLRHPWAVTGQVGGAKAYLIPLVPAVDRAWEWLTANRHPF
jgi:aminoglycoside 3-N-acetyltransferase